MVPDRAAAAGERRRDPHRRAGRRPRRPRLRVRPRPRQRSRRSARVATACRCRWTERRGASRWPRARDRIRRPRSRVKPVQARFVRITQTGTPPTATAWAIQRVRIFTVGAAARRGLGPRCRSQSINPATGETLATFDTLVAGRGDGRARSARSRRFASWRNTPFERARAAADACRRHPRERVRALGRLMTLEMGKPLRAGDRRGAEVRARVPLLRRARRAIPRRRARRAPRRRRATSATSRSASCSPSCRGTFRSGRCSASRRRR